jgi:hypothetical protein
MCQWCKVTVTEDTPAAKTRSPLLIAPSGSANGLPGLRLANWPVSSLVSVEGFRGRRETVSREGRGGRRGIGV